MHAGKEIKLRRGALWACAFPMGFGIALAALMATRVNYNGQTAFIVIFAVPVYCLTALILLAPLTAWLTGFCLRRIAKAEKLRQWRIIFVSALIFATCLQALLGLGFAIYLSIEYEKIFGVVKRAAEMGTSFTGEIPNAYRTFVIASSVMWIALTVPFCAAGTSIFVRKTKFPADRGIF